MKKLGAEHSPNIDGILDAEFSVITAAWKGTPVLVTVRELSSVQLMACGNFSMIDLGELKASKFDWGRWVEYSEVNYRIMRASLVRPAYDDIVEAIGTGPMVDNARAEIERIQALIFDLPRGPKRQAYERELNSLRCMVDLIFPDDFISAVVAYATWTAKSDIKLITREMLLSLAVLAEHGHDNPADHIDGMFTKFNREDINRRAKSVLIEERERMQKSGGKRAAN